MNGQHEIVVHASVKFKLSCFIWVLQNLNLCKRSAKSSVLDLGVPLAPERQEGPLTSLAITINTIKQNILLQHNSLISVAKQLHSSVCLYVCLPLLTLPLLLLQLHYY